MRTQKKRIEDLHRRAEEIRHRKERTGTLGLGGFCLCVFILIVKCMTWVGDPLHNTIRVGMQGASLLSDNAGGYVLAGVIAFFAGVVITAAIIRYRKK